VLIKAQWFAAHAVAIKGADQKADVLEEFARRRGSRGFRCAYRNAGERARRWRAGSLSGLPPAPQSPPPGGRSSPAGPTAARGRPSGAGRSGTRG
jgi:hypothetical protein